MSNSWYGDVVGMTVLQDHKATLPFLCYRVLLCGWEHGTTASSAGLFVNTANEFPATILSVEVPELSHKNVVASEASNSRLVKEKARVCVTNFTCILLENQVHAAVRVSVSSKSFFKNSLSAVHFRCVFGCLGTFLAI